MRRERIDFTQFQKLPGTQFIYNPQQNFVRAATRDNEWFIWENDEGWVSTTSAFDTTPEGLREFDPGHIVIQPGVDIDLGLEDFTAETWFWLDDTPWSWNTIMSQRANDSEQLSFEIQYYDQKLRLRCNDGADEHVFPLTGAIDTNRAGYSTTPTLTAYTPVNTENVANSEGMYTSQPNGWFTYTITNDSGDASLDDNKYKIELHKAFNRWDEIITVAPYNGWNLHIDVYWGTRPQGILASAFLTNYVYFDPQGLGKATFGNTFPVSGEFVANHPNMSYMYGITGGGVTLMYTVFVHELGHNLGIGKLSFNGTYVSGKPMVNYTDENDGIVKRYYTGANAVREYKNAFPAWADGIQGLPISDLGDAESPAITGGHAEEGYAQNIDGHIVSTDTRMISGYFHPGLESELMSPYTDEPDYMPLSRISIGLLQDLGYNVDYTKADVYNDVAPVNPWGRKTHNQYPTLAVQPNSWHHVALVRKDGVISVFMDGAKVNDSYSTPIDIQYSDQPLLIGAAYTGDDTVVDYPLIGYMQDIRLIEQAVYVEDFDPTGEPLQSQKGGTLLGDPHVTTFAGMKYTL